MSNFTTTTHAVIVIANMGRAKLKMQLIDKEKSRIQTFNKRSDGLRKKLHQLTTLCAVDACMIINGPHNSVWPHDNPDQVRRMIAAYHSKSKQLGSVKTYGLTDFFEDRRRKAHDEAAKLRKKNSYATWCEELDAMSEAQLRRLGAALLAKAHHVRVRIQFLKQELENMMLLRVSSNQSYNHVNNFVDVPYFGHRHTNFAYDAVAHHHQYYAPQPLNYMFPPPLPNMHYSMMDNVSFYDDGGQNLLPWDGN